jgi:hypothetical protein
MLRKMLRSSPSMMFLAAALAKTRACQIYRMQYNRV